MKKTVGTFIVLFVTVLVIGGAWAQPLPTAKPEQVGMSSERLARLGPALKAQIANDRFPGAVVIVARKGKVVYFETVGQRDPATGAPMTKDAIFRLYSMTKPFTSVAAMILVEEGKLLLADPVSKYFPELANPQVALKETTDGKTTYRLVPAERPITIQDLLRHTSGFAYANNTLNEQVKAAYGAAGAGAAGTPAGHDVGVQPLH
jgi:CubicO group peptidase (beta-lactamase class C family)